MNMFEAVEKCGLRWPKSGMLNCPAHKDRTPSLKLYQNDFYCFSCGANGDAYGFIAHWTSTPIGEVLRLHKQSGVQAPSKMSRGVLLSVPMRIRNAYKETHDQVFDALWQVVGMFETDYLVEELTRMSVYFDELSERIADMSGVDALREIAEAKKEQMDWITERSKQLHHGGVLHWYPLDDKEDDIG